MIFPLWAYLAAALVWVASLLGYGAIEYGHGERDQQQICQADKSRELLVALDENARLTSLVKATEAKHQGDMARIDGESQARLRDEQVRNARLLDDLRHGAVRLRQPASPDHRAAGKPSAVGASAGQCDGGTAGYLSSASAEFLYGLAAEADDVAGQLAECQQVIVADRTTGQVP